MRRLDPKAVPRLVDRFADVRLIIAHAGIADCLSHLLDAGDASISEADILEQSEKALALNPELAEAHASLGLVLPGKVVVFRYACDAASSLSWQARHEAVPGPCGE